MELEDISEIDSMRNFADYALAGAVQEGNDYAVRVSLIRGADPNFKFKLWKDMMKKYIEKYEDTIKKQLVIIGEMADLKVPETESDEILKNYALLGAVQNEDVEAVREFLSRGADPNSEFTVNSALMENSSIEISKLIIKYGYTVNEQCIEHIFFLKSSSFIKEIVSYILNQRKVDNKLILYIYYLLFSFNLEPSDELEILKQLLAHGLPMDVYLKDFDIDSGLYTTLHYSLPKPSFTKLLLEHGADPNKKALDPKGHTPFIMAVETGDESLVKLFLKNGAKINDARNDGYTALHLAAVEKRRPGDFGLILLLLERGADINAETNNGGKTPLMLAENDEVQAIFVQEFAKLGLEGEHISDANFDHLQNEDDDYRLYEMFDDCLDELLKMKEYDIFNGLSLYDILKMRGQYKKLVSLTRKETFDMAFELDWDRECFINYADELDYSITVAKKIRDKIHEEKEKIYETGLDKKFLIPSEIMDMIVEYAIEDLYYE